MVKLESLLPLKYVMDCLKQSIPRYYRDTLDCYWANITEVLFKRPSQDEFPTYYREKAAETTTWFKIIAFAPAYKSIMDQYVVTYSGRTMSDEFAEEAKPYFKIRCAEQYFQ